MNQVVLSAHVAIGTVLCFGFGCSVSSVCSMFFRLSLRSQKCPKCVTHYHRQKPSAVSSIVWLVSSLYLLHRWLSGFPTSPQGDDSSLFLHLQLPLSHHSDGAAGRPEAWVYLVCGARNVGFYLGSHLSQSPIGTTRHQEEPDETTKTGLSFPGWICWLSGVSFYRHMTVPQCLCSNFPKEVRIKRLGDCAFSKCTITDEQAVSYHKVYLRNCFEKHIFFYKNIYYSLC